MTKLADKVAVVTGAASGIGMGIAEAFVEQGAKVVIADVDTAGSNQLVEQLGSDNAIYIATDVTVEAEIKNCIDKAKKTYERLDIMVNNAGVSGTGTSIEDVTVEDFHFMMKADLLSVVLGMKHAVQSMKNQNGGSIINISSIQSRQAAGVLFYNIAKAAVNQATRFVAFEAGQHKIRVNAIEPGVTATPFHTSHWGLESNEEVFDRLKGHFAKLQAIPYGLGQEEIGKAAVFLAADDSRLMTGQVLTVDGGITLHPYPTDIDGYFAALDPSGALLEKSKKDGLL